MSLRFTFQGSLKFCAILMILISNIVLADGTGTLKGKVIDATTKETLPAAAVVVKGTTLGAASDLDGNYIVYNIPAGKRTITVSYLGYTTISVEVDIVQNKTVTKNISLEFTTITGQEVVVTAQAQGQMEAINQQLNSDKIASIVSEAKIQELPDFNAAAAISRLPGVSTTQSSGEANKVVIRGLAPEYNSVQVEGVKMASTGSTTIGAVSQTSLLSNSIITDRSVDLSSMTPYMIKSIAVYKSLTPDMNGNAIGGVVNMELREAPPELHYDLMWQSGYTQKSDKYGNYRAVGSVSTRFFDNLLGVYFLGNLESYDRNADNMNGTYYTSSSVIGTSGYRPVKVNQIQLTRHIETRERAGGNLILDYSLPEGTIRSINMFTRMKSDYQDYRTILDYKSSPGNIDYTYRGGINTIDAMVNSIEWKQDFGFIQTSLKFANTYSSNKLPKSPYMQFRQTGGIAPGVKENTIPDELTNLIKYGADTAYLNSVSMFSTKYKENNQLYTASVKMPFEIESFISGYIKLGGDFKHDYHVNDQETPYIDIETGSLTGTNFKTTIMNALRDHFGIPYSTKGKKFVANRFTNSNTDLFDTFLDNKYGKMYWVVDPSLPVAMADYVANDPQFAGRAGTDPGGFFNGPFQQMANDYSYSEDYYAGYFMTDVKFLDFTVVGGVRYEKDKIGFTAYNMADARDPQHQTYTKVAAKPTNEFWLPMVQVKYAPFEFIDLRYSFTKTLARPNYNQISPHVTFDYNLNNVWAGNPRLKTGQAFNHDLIISFHNNEIGLVTVGGFYKTVKDFTYYTKYQLHKTNPTGLDSLGSFSPTPADNANLYTYINSPYDAIVKGYEIDFQTRLWWLPEIWNGIVLGMNYTHIKSEAKYPFMDNRTFFDPTHTPRIWTALVDSSREGRLIQQPNDIVNAYIGFDYKDFSARVSAIFQGNSVSYVGAFPEEDTFTKDYFRVDASVKQILPWARIEIYLDLVNLNNRNNNAAQKSTGGFTNVQNYGLTGNVGVRYRI